MKLWQFSVVCLERAPLLEESSHCSCPLLLVLYTRLKINSLVGNYHLTLANQRGERPSTAEGQSNYYMNKSEQASQGQGNQQAWHSAVETGREPLDCSWLCYWVTLSKHSSDKGSQNEDIYKMYLQSKDIWYYFPPWLPGTLLGFM